MIGFDFIVKLPLSVVCDSILVIVDYFSKGVHCVASKNVFSAEEFVFHFFDCFICNHELTYKILLNGRDLSVSCFWKELQHLLRVKLASSTAWKP